MTQKTVKSKWENYLRLVVPKESSEIQKRETELSFYAGATSLFTLILSLLAPGTEPTDADLKLIDDIYKELNQFTEIQKRSPFFMQPGTLSEVKNRKPLEVAENKAREIGRLIKAEMPEGWAFFLILASLDSVNDKFPCMTYLSTAERECSIKLLREMAEKLEKDEPNI